MDQKFIDLYDEYTHAPLDRRVFLQRLTELAGSAAAAAAILPLLGPNPAKAAIVPANDPRLTVRTATYAGATGEMRGYLVRPQGTGKLPAVIVVHENRGVNPHIQDVARRLALEGFLVYAIDFMSPLGGTPEDADAARAAFMKLDAAQSVDSAVKAVAFLESHPESTGKVGAVGFCWGGGIVNNLATKSPALDAGVAYYGRVPPAGEVANIKAPMLLHYGGLDRNVNEGIPGYEEALKKAGVRYEAYVYENAQHAFNNETDASRYNEAAAKASWQRTVDFLKKNLA